MTQRSRAHVELRTAGNNNTLDFAAPGTQMAKKKSDATVDE